MAGLAGILIVTTGLGAGFPGPARTPAASPAVAMPRSAPQPVAVQPSTPDPLASLIRLALGRNPEIQAARQKWIAQAHQVAQDAAWENPRLEFAETPANGGFSYAQLSQEVPWPGKSKLKGQVAAAEAGIARAEWLATQLKVIHDTKTAYYDLHHQERAIAAITAVRGAVNRAIARARPTLGRADSELTESDLLRAEAELLNYDNLLLQHRQLRDAARVRLCQAAQLPPTTPLQTPASLTLDPVPPDGDALVRAALQRRPEIRAQVLAQRRDAQGVELARKSAYPDVTAGIVWDHVGSRALRDPCAGLPAAGGSSRSQLGFSVGLEIPLHRDKLRAAVAQAQARQRQSAWDYQSTRDETVTAVYEQFTQARTQANTLQLLSTRVVPKQARALALATGQFEKGKLELTTLVDIANRLLEFRLLEVQTQAQLEEDLAGLEQVVGSALTTSTRQALQSPSPAPGRSPAAPSPR